MGLRAQGSVPRSCLNLSEQSPRIPLKSGVAGVFSEGEALVAPHSERSGGSRFPLTLLISTWLYAIRTSGIQWIGPAP